MVLVLGPEPDTAAVVQPKSSVFRLLLRHFQPFLLPDPGHPLHVDLPAFGPEKSRDPPVAVAAILFCQLDDPSRQGCLVFGHLRSVALCSSVLAQDPAGPTFTDAHSITNMIDRKTPARRAQKFPRLASLRMEMSRAWSATSFFRRWFSRSSSFRRWAWLTSMPPYSLRQR